MSEDIKEILKPEEEEFAGIKLRKPTAGTLSLCDFAKLSMVTGQQTEFQMFEAIAFFYIHSKALKDARKSVLSAEDGFDADGRSLKFVADVMDWADSVELGDVNKMGDKIGEMLNDALNPKVSPTDDGKPSDSEVEELVSKTEKVAKKKG
jgi:hypothetical protein